MSSPAETLRQRIRQRAGNRCEYCRSHQNYILGTLLIISNLSCQKFYKYSTRPFMSSNV